VGTALQYGEATIDKKSFAGQDLRRSNFTAASCRSCNFAKTKLNGAGRGGGEGGKKRKSTNVRVQQWLRHERERHRGQACHCHVPLGRRTRLSWCWSPVSAGGSGEAAGTTAMVEREWRKENGGTREG